MFHEVIIAMARPFPLFRTKHSVQKDAVVPGSSRPAPREQVLVLGDPPPHEDAREHHADGHGKENMDEAPCRDGADGSEEPEHDEDQSER